MNYFFTSDTEFGHKNIIEYTNRPFSSMEEMDETLIERWNEIVKPKDRVYHLGDFCYGSFFKYFNKLNGSIHFVRGNHDRFPFEVPFLLEVYIPNLMDEIDPSRKKLIVLSHYSMRSWNLSHYGSWHLFGHHHGQINSYGLSFDVGVDTNNYYPYSLDQVIERMKELKPIVDFRRK